MASSSVPASEYESPRRALTEGDLEALLRRRRVLGVAEMMNFPGVVVGRRCGAREACARDARRRPCAGRQRPGSAGIRRRGDPFRPRGVDARRGTRAPARRDVAAHARGVGRAQPRARCCRSSASTARTGIAFCTDDREPEHIAEDGHINAMVRDAVEFGVSPEDALVHGVAQPGALPRARPPRRDRARAPGRHAVLLGDLERFVPELVLKRGQAGRARSRARRCPTGCGTRCGSARSGPRSSGSRGRGGSARVIGLVPGQIITESLVDEPEAPRRRGRRRSRARPREDRRDRAAPRHRAHRPRLRPRVRPPSRRDRLDALARRAQRRRRRHRRHVDGVRRAHGSRTSAAGSSSSTAASCSPSCRCPSPGSSPTRRSPRSSPRATRVVAAARELGCEIEAPFQLLAVPGAVGDPRAEDHRPRPRRRRAVRARARCSVD